MRVVACAGRTGTVALGLAAFLPLLAAGQTLADLKTPPSPGFTILGLAPTEIERPTTPMALGIGVASATDAGNVIPESYALEVSPYWLTPKPLLTFSESLALSFATDRGPEDADSARLGVGARVQLLSGRPSLRTDLAQDSLETLLAVMGDVLDEIEELEGDNSARTVRLRARLQARADSLEWDEGRLRRDFQSRQWSERSGVRWEIAGAVASSFPTETFTDGDVTGWGVWSTMSFKPAAEALDILWLLRFQQLAISAADAMGVSVEIADQDVLDTGVRILHGSGPVTASAELLVRMAGKVDDRSPAAVVEDYDSSYRVTANFEYRITEAAALQWTFGRGFALAGIDRGKLISLIGLKWALGQGLALPLS